MTQEVFLDSSALFVFADHSNEKRKLIKEHILENKPSIITTNFVFAETVSLVTKRLGKRVGLTIGELLTSSDFVSVVHVTEDIQQEAWQLYRKYKDKDFDLVDATSFVVCQKRKIREALTFDHHFSQMGFKTYPS